MHSRVFSCLWILLGSFISGHFASADGLDFSQFDRTFHLFVTPFWGSTRNVIGYVQHTGGVKLHGSEQTYEVLDFTFPDTDPRGNPIHTSYFVLVRDSEGRLYSTDHESSPSDSSALKPGVPQPSGEILFTLNSQQRIRYDLRNPDQLVLDTEEKECALPLGNLCLLSRWAHDPQIIYVLLLNTSPPPPWAN